MGTFIKTGYVKIVSGGKIVNILSYEQLAISKALRIGATRHNGQISAKAYCCCRAENPPELIFNDNGDIIQTGNSKHTEVCDNYRKQILNAIQGSALSAELNRNAPFPVDFSWSPQRGAKFEIIGSSSLIFGSAFSFSSWVAYNNIVIFSYRFSGIPINKFRNDKIHTSDFYFRIGSKRICNVRSKKADNTILFNDEQIFDHAEVDEQNLFYGRILWSSSFNSESDSKKFAYLRCRNERGNEIGFRVPLKSFMETYEKLPVHTGDIYSDNVWICGFVRKQELMKADELPKGMKLGGINPTKSIIPANTAGTYIVNTMRFGRLFNCNDMGMIVFTKDEYRKSNYLLSCGNTLYRPVIISSAYTSGIYFFNPNGEDIPIEKLV